MIEFSNVSITNDFGDYTRDSDLQEQEIGRLRDLREYYLLDLKMLGTGNLFEDKGDLQVIGGLTNLSQALTHRLMTDRGTHPMDETLGVPWSAYLGQTYIDNEIIKYELMQEIVSEIYKDIRVESVDFIDVKFLDINTIAVELTVAPTGLGASLGVELDVNYRGD